MQIVYGRNVNTIYPSGVEHLRSAGDHRSSRAGGVLATPWPVMSVYTNPTERVLFCQNRDANPFFHFMESLWMLAGRDDAAFLNTFVRDFGERFAEENGILHGAYGRRWRSWFELDQLEVVVQRLRKNPDDRRVVIAMWDPDEDLLEPDYINPFPEPRDLPCNTHVYPRIVDGRLDITICCRSNDIIWGAYGANSCHFSVLQEYLAARIDCNVGKLYQLSNNFHAYLPMLEKIGTPESHDPYEIGAVRPMRLVDDPGMFDTDLKFWMENPRSDHFRNKILGAVATPMYRSYEAFREKNMDRALEWARLIEAEDWSLACQMWLQRRRK